MIAHRHRVPWAGLAAGPAAWAVNQQLTYMIVPWVCASGINLIPVLALVFGAVAAAGAFLSWTTVGTAKHLVAESHRGGHPRRLLAGVSVCLALLLALVILIQGAAALILNACAR